MEVRAGRGGGTSAGSDVEIIALVSAAHFLSHFLQLTLPPLFPIEVRRQGEIARVCPDHMRNIPDHWHAHARPAGGFFGPRR